MEVQRNVYRYDMALDKYEKLKDALIPIRKTNAVVVDNDIYTIGGYMSTHVQKFDTINEVYSTFSNVPYGYSDGYSVAIGTDVYMVGSGTGTAKQFYKYDTVAGTFSNLGLLPQTFYNGAAVSVGTDIYYFGGTNQTRQAYKYSTETTSFTELKELPEDFQYSRAVVYNGDIYLIIRTGNQTPDYVYKYDIANNDYTRVTNLALNNIVVNSSVVAAGNKIYLFGGSDNLQALYFPKESYKKNTVMVAKDKGYTGKFYTDLITSKPFLLEDELNRYPVGFNDAWLSVDENLLELPTYYGDGEQWIKFKN